MNRQYEQAVEAALREVRFPEIEYWAKSRTGCQKVAPHFSDVFRPDDESNDSFWVVIARAENLAASLDTEDEYCHCPPSRIVMTPDDQ